MSIVTISINNVFCQISYLTDIRVIDKLDRELSYYVEGYQYMPSYKARKWDGRTRLLTNQLKFQTGLLPYVEDILRRCNVQYQLNDTREDVILGEEIAINKNYYIPRDYQIQTVDECLKHKCGLVKIATGGGKSFVISMLIAKTNIKTVVYVISLDLLYQTKKAIEDALGITCGIVGGGECVIRQITVATPYTISNAYDKVYDPFDDEESRAQKESLGKVSKIKIQKMVEDAQMFVFDEVQFLAASSFQWIAKNSKHARYRLGFSATPWRNDNADLALTAVTGKQLIDIDATTLINKHVLVPPKIYFFDVPELDGYKINNHGKKSYASIYDAYIVENKNRNEMIIEAAIKLREKNKKILILVKRKKHGLKLLESMPKNIATYFINGDAPIEERQAVKTLFNINKIDIIIASSIFDTGVDLPILDALILAGSGKSSIRALQRIGRIIRSAPNKTHAIVVDFIDNAPFLIKHSKERCIIYKCEKAFDVKLPEHINW